MPEVIMYPLWPAYFLGLNIFKGLCSLYDLLYKFALITLIILVSCVAFATSITCVTIIIYVAFMACIVCMTCIGYMD